MQIVMSWHKGNYHIGDVKRYGTDDTPENYLRLQIENNLRLGWKPNEIIIGTNFKFEYLGIKSYEVPTFATWSAFANKLATVSWLINNKILTGNLFIHDCDVFTLMYHDFPVEVKDIGMVRHSLPNRDKRQGGVTYVSMSAYDMIHSMANEIIERKVHKEESYFGGFYRRPENINRFTWLNYRWNMFRQCEFSRKYPLTELPVVNCHLHPEDASCWNCFVEGKNKFNIPIITLEVKELMLRHGLYHQKNNI